MQDRHIHFHLTTILAAVAGCIGVGLVVANFFVMAGDDELGIAGLAFICLAATLRVRSWFVRMSHRERTAYEVGRASVRSLR